MNVIEEAEKNSDSGRNKCHWRFLQDLPYNVVFYKTLIEKYFC